jgi:hypothetical protein
MYDESRLAEKKALMNENTEILKQFINTYKNDYGDLYMFWTIWLEIKKELIKSNVYEELTISQNILEKFKLIKQKYMAGIKTDETMIIKHLNESGKLNTINELYYYVSVIPMDINELITKYSGFVDIISKKLNINKEYLSNFIKKYFEICFDVNKRKWLYRYEIHNNLADDLDDKDIYEWINKEMHYTTSLTNDVQINFPTNIVSQESKNNVSTIKLWESPVNSNVYLKWPFMYEIYLKAFSNHVIYNFANKHFINSKTGDEISFNIANIRLKIENTVVRNKSQYIIQHFMEISESGSKVFILTNVQLQVLFEINPIYYYMFYLVEDSLFDDILKNYPSNIKELQLIKRDIQNIFDINVLKRYIDNFPDQNFKKVFEKLIKKN